MSETKFNLTITVKFDINADGVQNKGEASMTMEGENMNQAMADFDAKAFLESLQT